MYISHSKPYINEELVIALTSQTKKGNLARGELTVLFEQELSKYLNNNRAFLTSSGTAAIYLALKTLEIKEGEEVILPTYVCHSVKDAVILAGGTPILCDIGDHWVMEPSNVESLINKKTRAIIVVHIFGIIAKIKEFKKFGIPIIEDCCQCFIDKIDKEPIGKEADFVTYSFHATKCLTTGEGGALTCNNNKFIQKLSDLYDLVRSISAFSDIQATLGLSQLKVYPAMVERRKQIAHRYLNELRPHLVQCQKEVSCSMFFRFLIRIHKDFEQVKLAFHETGIAVRKGVDALIHFSDHEEIVMPFAESTFTSTISLPIYPALTDEEVDRVVAATNRIIK